MRVSIVSTGSTMNVSPSNNPLPILVQTTHPLRAPWQPAFFVLLTGKRRYNIKLWKTFTDCFNCLPIAAIIDEKIFTMHGGLSPDLQSMEQIRRVMRPTDVPDTGTCRSTSLLPPSTHSALKLTTRVLGQAYYVISYGPIQTRTLQDGRKTIEGCHSRLGQI